MEIVLSILAVGLLVILPVLFFVTMIAGLIYSIFKAIRVGKRGAGRASPDEGSIPPRESVPPNESKRGQEALR